MRQDERQNHAYASPRRKFLQRATAIGIGAAMGRSVLAATREQVMLPFNNGERSLVAFPQKRPLIVLTSRPPQLETPFAIFNDNVITPNDAFFVRYHWSGIPTVGGPADLSAAHQRQGEHTA